jgi:hypothetical protein
MTLNIITLSIMTQTQFMHLLLHCVSLCQGSFVPNVKVLIVVLSVMLIVMLIVIMLSNYVFGNSIECYN